MRISGILLIVAGLSAIFCGGIASPNRSQTPDMGLIQVNDTGSQTERIPPILGIAGVAAGGGLIYCGRKQRG
jgi:LPXTG-motif cell wall-anchored protein